MGLSVYYTVPAAYTEASKRAENPVIEMPGRALPLPHFLRVSKVFPLRSIQGPIFNFGDFWQPGSLASPGPPARGFRVLGWKPGGLRQARFSRAGRKSDFGLLGSEFWQLGQFCRHPMCTRMPLTPQRLANRRYASFP